MMEPLKMTFSEHLRMVKDWVMSKHSKATGRQRQQHAVRAHLFAAKFVRTC